MDECSKCFRILALSDGCDEPSDEYQILCWSCQYDEIDRLQTKLDEANKTIERLPLTADGVRRIPRVDSVFFYEPSSDSIKEQVLSYRYQNEWTVHVDGRSLPISDVGYSTPEAAEAAKESSDG